MHKRSDRSLTRRSVLLGSAATAATVVSPLPASATPGWRSENPFSLGVASGDPLPDSVVLWTRLAPKPLEPFGGMPRNKVPVQWQVAADEHFRKVVRKGTTLALPDYAHSVHVDVKGLEPGRHYYYRFKAGPELSPVGRTKTAPPVDAHLGTFTFAFASCQAWFDGYYTAYEHMAEEDLDVVLHLGDYLYEYAIGPKETTRNRRDFSPPDRYNRVTQTLDDYRGRYALYKLDPGLQAAHAAFPWIVTMDDHEVVNNWADEDHQSAPPEDFLVRRANAFRAYWEHMPLRLSRLPQGPDMPLYRRFTFGAIAEFNVLDTRQYRDDQPSSAPYPDEKYPPSRTITGAEQERWLLSGLGSSRARWNVLAQQVMMSQLDIDPGTGQSSPIDTWNGYVESRDRVLSGIVQRNVRNPIVLAGDIHRNMAANLKANFDDPDSATIGTEFIGTSISSGRDGADMDDLGRTILQENPHVQFYNQQRGYVRCELTPSQWRSDYRVVPYVLDRGAPISTRASFAVQDGTPGLQKTGEAAAQGDRFDTGVLREFRENPERMGND